MAREHPHSEGGGSSTSLTVGNETVGETPQHQELGSSDALEVTSNPTGYDF